jgi:hypothetical protein
MEEQDDPDDDPHKLDDEQDDRKPAARPTIGKQFIHLHKKARMETSHGHGDETSEDDDVSSKCHGDEDSFENSSISDNDSCIDGDPDMELEIQRGQLNSSFFSPCVSFFYVLTVNLLFIFRLPQHDEAGDILHAQRKGLFICSTTKPAPQQLCSLPDKTLLPKRWYLQRLQANPW